MTVASALVTVSAAPASADPPASGPGSLDTTFGPGFSGAPGIFQAGATGTAVDAVITQPDGKIVAAIGDGSSFVTVYRLTSSGGVDATFANSGGAQTISGVGTPVDGPQAAVAEDASGRVYVGTAQTNGAHPLPAVFRLKADGSKDTSWGGVPDGVVTHDFGGNPNDHVTSVVVDDSIGRVYATVWQGPNPGTGTATDFTVMAFNEADGSLDTTFSGNGIATFDFNGGNDTPRDAALAPNGDLVVVGFVNAVATGQPDDTGMIRVNRSGTLVAGFGKVQRDISGTGNDGARSVVVAADGTIYVSGTRFTNPVRGYVAAFNGDGSLKTSFDAQGSPGSGGVVFTAFEGDSNGSGNAGLSLDARGRVLVVGDDQRSELDHPGVARLVDNRYATDTTFEGAISSAPVPGAETLTCPGGGVSGGADGVSVQSDGKIVVAGTCAGKVTVWRLDGGDQLPLPSTPTGDAGLSAANISVNGGGRTLTVQPGAAITVSLDWSIPATGDTNIDQLVGGFVNDGPSDCINLGIPTGGASGSGTLHLSAPTVPGHYFVGMNFVQWYGCRASDGYPGGPDWVTGGKAWNHPANPSEYLAEIDVTALQPPANLTWVTATDITNGLVADERIDQPGENRWYKFQVAPGGNVSATLSNLAANDDIALFADIKATFDEFASEITGTPNDTADLTQLSQENAQSNYAPSHFAPSHFAPSHFAPSHFAGDQYDPNQLSASDFQPDQYNSADFAPSHFAPSHFAGDEFSPSHFAAGTPEADEFREAYSAAQLATVLAVSSNDGTAPETVSAPTWNNNGFFYVRVQGRNGLATSPQPFHMAVTVVNGICDHPFNFYGADPSLSGSGTTAQTLILDNSQRMAVGTTLQSKLSALATKTNGVVVDVSGSQKVRDLDAQADSMHTCSFAKNLVAQAIRDIVNSYRATNPIKNVIIIGDDDVIPFFRYADQSGLGPESDYVPPVTDASSAQAALRNSQVLGQDAYGSKTDILINGQRLPVPDLAVGRLVETPTEIGTQIDNFTGLTNGLLSRPSSSLVTGYDFLQDGADKVQGDLSAGIATGGRADTLITNNGVNPNVTTVNNAPDRTHSWTAADLKSKLLGSHHDVVFLAGHFSANDALAADFTSDVVTTDVQAAAQTNPALLRNTLLFSVGCHSGYNLEDADGVSGVTLGLDWPETFAAAGATLVAGTGFQYGDTDFVEYSERLYANFAQQLRAGTGAVSVGSALIKAKQAYLAAVPQLTGMHQKALLEATIYGIPMAAVDMPGTRLPVVPPLPSITGGKAAIASPPGSVLGLSSVDHTVTPATTPHAVDLVDQSNATVHASYLSGDNGVVTRPGEPVLPLSLYDATSPDAGDVLRGVGFRSGSYTDTGGVIPLTGAAATEVNSVHAGFSSPALFPQTMWTPNYFDALSPGGSGKTTLQVTPVQHVSDPSGTTDTRRAFDSLGLRLFYSNNTTKYGNNVPALAGPPNITEVRSQPGGGGFDVSAHVVGDPAAGMQAVWVTATGGPDGSGHGTWSSSDLIQDPTDSTLWTGHVTVPVGAGTRFVVQAVNGVGVVALDNNQGFLFTPGIVPGLTGSTATPTSLSLDTGNASSGARGATVTVGATLTGPTDRSGRTVQFTIGAASTSGVSDASGHASATLQLRDAGSPGLVASYAGSATDGPSSDHAAFTVNKSPTSLAVTGPGSAAVGGSTGVVATLTSSGLPLRQKSVALVVRDNAGAVAATVVGGTNLAGQLPLGTLTLPTGQFTATAYFANGTPTGTTVSLAPDADYAGATSAPFTFRLDYRFIGLSQPVNDPVAGNQSVFKGGSTVPLKFQLGVAGTALVTDTLAASIASGGKATVSFQHISASTGQVDESLYTDVPTAGNTFRYDATAHQFIFNWGTKGLDTGNWSVTVTVKRQDGTAFTHSVVVGLR